MTISWEKGLGRCINMFEKAKMRKEIEAQELLKFKAETQERLLSDLSPLEISNYGIIFDLKKNEVNEFNVKNALLKSNKDLFSVEEIYYISNFIFQQYEISKMSNLELMKMFKEEVPEEQLKRPLVYELSKNKDVITLEEAEAIYKHYALEKNKEKFEEEDYKEYKELFDDGFGVRLAR